MDLEKIPVVDKDDLLKMIDSDNTIILNVLASHAYEKLHIKNSISAPYDKLENGELDELGRGKKIVVYCASYNCGASRKAASLLREKGLDASAYEGGIKEWAESGFPTEGNLTAEEYLAGL